jgi:hypothetical protein
MGNDVDCEKDVIGTRLVERPIFIFAVVYLSSKDNLEETCRRFCAARSLSHHVGILWTAGTEVTL